MLRGNNINRFLRGCSDHRDQLFCLFELKKHNIYSIEHLHQLYSIHPAILYIQKKPFLSVLHSVYDVSVLSTLHFILALLNLPLTSLNEVTTVTSSTNKYDAPQTSPANSVYKPKTSTNLNEYHS